MIFQGDEQSSIFLYGDLSEILYKFLPSDIKYQMIEV